MEIILREINSITPYSKNAKIHDATQIANVANSIKRFGWQQPIVIDDNGVVVIGHCRLQAAKKLGLKEVPVTIASGLTEDEIKELRIADNKTNESPWDFELLEDDRQGLEFDGFEFDWTDLKKVLEEPEVVEDDFDPDETPEEPTAKLGDIYQLGRHRLICGDCTDPETIEKLVDGEKIDLLLTDPPYNVNVGNCERPNSSNDGVHILNDSMQESDFIAFLAKALFNACCAMRAGAAYYIWYAGLHHIEFESAVREIKDFKLHEQLVWVKSHFVLGRNSDYQWMHEPCLYGWKTGATHYFTDSRAEGTVIEDKDVKLSTLKKDELIALCEKWMGINKSTTILRANKPASADLHPTVKPQELLCRLIKNSSQQGWNVLDMFGGSGSTLIACEQLNRRCYMAELDPHYIDVIIARWEKFTGEKAVLIDE